ncbi:outer membrane protein transport protein [Thauera sp. CAU 1555]|jgi:long-chain fatty acid transport protein|uniref:Outer membrane protein transport protein n=1 Tax=Thauera sedimentorum TaxID=2767595 RepID=A0ABR9BB08_9RHOO|nr:outer membrane protein transport protein [Thauera sedimentorum]MBC9072614.1 outer membrane protein transport protein [Thauera sedimentorum]MBD8503533.1 outer membrane protein transport protein [Thauera sedimentorum]
MKLRKLAVWIPLVASGAFVSGHAMAAGFALQNQNGAGTGYAYAGSAAVAEDASTIFFNPAGMTYLAEGHHVTGALTLLDRSLEFKDRGTNQLRVAAPPVPAYPLGGDGGQAGGQSYVPAAFWTMSITPELRIGLGVSPTFGNATEWDDDFMGRYQGNYSEIKAINVNPSVAWKVNDLVSLGFGVNMVKFEADLRGMIPVTAALPATVDVENKLSGDDTGYGWNAGAMFQVTPTTRIGLTYRSSIDLKVKGKSENPAGSTPVQVKIELPDTASLALSQKIGERLELLADYTWTGWSSIPSLRVTHRGSGALLTDEHLGFKDAYRVGVGMQYQYTDALRLRAGLAYDESPVQSATDRTVRLPDSDRTWLAVGMNYKFTKQTSMDVGYAYLMFDEAKIRRQTVLGTTPTAQVVDGKFDTKVHILSVQLNHHF